MTHLDRPHDDLAQVPPAVVPVLLAGQVAPLTADGKVSGIAKRPIDGPWTITPMGLVGDAQADLENHGGVDKALHHYPFDHYAAWRDALGPHPLFAVGGFGENLSTTGWTEANIHLGDIVRLGAVTLEVSHGRQPCWKLNARFGRKKMALDVQTTGRTGWYYRVLEPGLVRPGDAMRIVDRPHEDWPLRRLIDLLYKRSEDPAATEALSEMPVLAADWRSIFRKRHLSRRTEDWTSRLHGAEAPS